MPKNTYQKIESYISDFLKTSGSTSEENTKNYIEIVEGVKSKILEGQDNLDPANNTIIAYLNRAANYDDESGVRSAGRKAGYFYSKTENLPQESEISELNAENIPQNNLPKSGKPSSRKNKNAIDTTTYEKTLYPLIKEWLIGAGYFAEDVSTGKKMGNGETLTF